MCWHLVLVSLSQPTLSDEAVKQRIDMMTELWDVLGGSDDVVEKEDPSDTDWSDDDKLALLQMAGRMPVRKIKNGSS